MRVVSLLFLWWCWQRTGMGSERYLHNPFLLSLGPWMTILLLHFIVTCCALNTSVHPESHIFPIETNELCVWLDKMCPSHASSGKDGKLS